MKIIKISNCLKCPYSNGFTRYPDFVYCNKTFTICEIHHPQKCPLEEDLLRLSKEVCMKKAVFILQPTVQNGVEGYIVKGWENVLKVEELPDEYRTNYPYFYETSERKIYISVNCMYDAYYIQKNGFYSKDEWKKRYEIMLQAGHRLGEILKEQRKPKIIRVEI